MSTSKSPLAPLLQQVQGNPRLKLGLLLVAAMLLWFAWDATHSWRVAMQKAAIQKEVELKRTRTLRGQSVWVERAKEAEDTRRALQARLPAVATPGLAQANLQTWLNSVVSGIPTKTPFAIDLTPPAEVEGHPGIYRVRARLSAELTPRQAFDLVNTLESSQNLTVIESAQIHSSKGQRAIISLASFYQTGTSAPPAAPAQNAEASVQ